MTLGERLQRARKKADETQKALADSFNVAQRTLIRWEQDECLPDGKALVKILAFLQRFDPDLTLAELLSVPEPAARVGRR